MIYYSKGSIGTYWDVYHMPIADRRHNLRLLEKAIEDAQPKNENELTLKDLAKPRVPDFVSKAPSKK